MNNLATVPASRDAQRSPLGGAMTGNSKEDNVYENRAYGIIERKEDYAYVEYGDKHKREEDSWWYICLACLMCR